MFETAEDIARFLHHLAIGVREGGLSIHAYSILSTHWHVAAGSPDAAMSDTLRGVQADYSREFNRARDRDGPLVRGRFLSKRIDSDWYFANVVRYIDANPIEAGLVVRAADYPFGSASAYESGGGPWWLDRGPVERLAQRMRNTDHFDADLYRSCFGSPVTADEREHLDRTLARGNRFRLAMGPVAGAHPIVQARLQERAAIADGFRVGCPLMDRATLTRLIETARSELGPWDLQRGHRRSCAWTALTYAWLHDLAGETQEAIAARVGRSRSVVRDGILVYRETLRVPEFAERVRSLLARLPEDARHRMPV
jgi:hypothetical protein